MRIINKKYLLIILLVGVLLTGAIIFKPKQEVKLDNVILKQEVNNNAFAMYTETDNGYEEYEGDKFPSGYRLNKDKSKCVDKEGIEIENALYTQDNKVGVKSNKSFYCYLYFDEKENLNNICNGSTMEDCMKNLEKLDKIKTIENLSDEIKGGMFRYQGQAVDVDNNYICFGTSDKDTCVSDTDHYMYRIIGIEESGRIKVIKKEALNETYQWYTDYDTDIDFPESKIYEAISKAGFLENKKYVPDGWEEKIVNKKWLYGDILNNSTLGVNQIGEELYLVETGKKDTEWYNLANQNDNGAIRHIVDGGPYRGKEIYYTDEKGNWTETVESKVSLIYLHDYYLSVGNSVNCYNNENNNFNICRSGWMHLSQNDSKAPYEHEWTMSKGGFSAWFGYFRGTYVNSLGYTDPMELNSSLSVRPTFYIIDNINLSGLGTIDNPYIIE